MSDRDATNDRERDSGRRDGVTSRRSFLATGATVTTASLVGCLGTSSGGSAPTTSGSSGETATSGDPETPWTTEALAEYIDDGSTVTIYAGTGDSQQWYDLITVINDEFGTNIEGNVFASDGGKVSQRFIQERQASNDAVDVLSNASDLRDQIKVDGESVAKQYFEWGLDQNFWFTDVLPDKRTLPFMVGAYNGGAGSVLPINETMFEERGLDIPETYNDLFEDQYEGLETLLPGYVVGSEVGWIIRYHAKQTDMDDLEWINTLADHLEFKGASSHTAGAREVRDGNAPMMFYNFPWVLSPFVSPDSPLLGHFVDGVRSPAVAGPLEINKNAPNPWVARFFVSAVLEEAVQRRMIHDVTDQVPVRLDLDYSAQNPDPYTKKRLNADVTVVGFWEGKTYSTVGQEAKDKGAFEV
ncbi:MAG: hypothetical protein V5A44_08920 [Haloarculaceae archaeon]